MKINYKCLAGVSLSAMLLFNPMNVSAKTLTAQDVVYETLSSQILSDGLTYEQKSKLTAEGWVDIHVLKMDLSNPHLELDVLRSVNTWGLRETLTSLADGKGRVIGGVNASFFDMSKSTTDIIGVEYDDDTYSSIKHNSGGTALIETELDGFLIDFLSPSLMITNEDGRQLYITGINTISDLSGASVFNRVAYQNSQVLDTKARLYKIVVSDSAIIDVAPPERSVDIPENGFIITINESVASYHLPSFAVEKYAYLTVNNTLLREDIKFGISGGGKILKDGQRVAPNNMVIQPGKRHPRTAVGLTSNGKYLILMVVDGRGESIGANNDELGTYLLEYSVSEAMHLDGGGSSEMVARVLGDTKNTIMNTPSDGSQRKLINGLGIVSTAPQGSLKTLEIKPSANKVALNMPISFKIVGYDEYYNPIAINPSDLVLVNKGITGKWTNQVFTPISADEGKVECQYNGITATVNVSCVDTFIDLEIQPKALQISTGKSGQFTLKGTDATGFKTAINPGTVTWKVADPSVGSFVEGVFIPKAQTGVTKIVAQVSGREISAYVIVGGDKTSVTSFEDVAISTLNFPETVSGIASTSSDQVLDGQKALKIHYQYPVSDQTQATYAMLENVMIHDKVQSLGLNVFGDNNNVYVRGKLIDATGAAFNITFTTNVNFVGWKYLEASVPTEAVYPLQLERVYTAATPTEITRTGVIYFDFLTQTKYYNTTTLKYDEEKIISDPLISSGPQVNDFVISVFGPTAARNRLLDDVVLQKVYDNMKETDLALFAGNSSVSRSKVTVPSLVWENKFSINDYSGVRVITLGTNSGGIVKTDANQWRLISSTLADTAQNNIIIVGNINPQVMNSFSDQREGDLLHNILNTYRQKTNKNIFYLNASGYKFNTDLKDGIRYIDLNGLWYNVSNNQKVDLNNSFNLLEFYINGSTMHYGIKNLYPKIEIGE